MRRSGGALKRRTVELAVYPPFSGMGQIPQGELLRAGEIKRAIPIKGKPALYAFGHCPARLACRVLKAPKA